MMDHNRLLALWNTDDFPNCAEGMMFARAYLTSCGEGVNRLNTEEPLDRMNDIQACYMALVEQMRGPPKKAVAKLTVKAALVGSYGRHRAVHAS
jgi:hypothetical protein